jgi:hypothetical protein
MSFMGFNARFDNSHHGLPHTFKDAEVVVDSIDRHVKCDGEVPLHCQQELHTQGFYFVPTED